MIKEVLKKGDIITTVDGELEIKDYNGSAFLCTESEYNLDEELEEKGTYWISGHDIAKRMKELDGENHKVVFESEDAE